MPNVQDRFTNAVVNSLPTGPHSDYYRVMGAGLTVFKTAPVLVLGLPHIANYARQFWVKPPNFAAITTPIIFTFSF